MSKVAEKIPMMRLADSYLCADLDCQTISTNAHRCPVCWSTVASLSKILNRGAK